MSQCVYTQYSGLWFSGERRESDELTDVDQYEGEELQPFQNVHDVGVGRELAIVK